MFPSLESFPCILDPPTKDSLRDIRKRLKERGNKEMCFYASLLPHCLFSVVDLWQTFEVDSLEHLEALEVVTTQLQNRVNICKANIMMVTSFDITARRRHKKRRRKAPEQRALKGIWAEWLWELGQVLSDEGSSLLCFLTYTWLLNCFSHKL